MSEYLSVTKVLRVARCHLLFFVFLSFGTLVFAENASLQTEVRSINNCVQQGSIETSQSLLNKLWSEHSDDADFVNAAKQIKDQFWVAEQYENHFDLCEKIVTSLPDNKLSIGIQVDQVTGYIKLKDLSKASKKQDQFWTRYNSDERFVDYARRIKDQYWQAGYYAEHFALCEKLIEQFPDDPLAMSIWTDDITGYIRTKNPKKAVEKLNEFWGKCSDKENFTKCLGTIKEVFLSHGYTDQYSALTSKIVEAYPNSPVSLGIYADQINATIHSGDGAGASKSLESFWVKHKDDTGFVNAVRRVKDQYWAEGQYDEHFNLCKRIVSELPDDPYSMGVQFDQITGCMKLDNMDLAKDELTRFWELFQSQEEFVAKAHTLAWEFRKNDNDATALQIYNDVKKQFPRHDRLAKIQVSVIDTYLGGKDSAGVAAAVEEMKNNFHHCKDYVGQAERAVDHLSGEKYHELAVEVCRSLLNQYPDHDDKIYFLQKKIRSELALGFKASADSDLKIIKNKFSSDKKYYDGLSWVAYVYRSYGHYGDSIELYEALYSENPDKVVKLRCDEGIARCSIRLGNEEKAVAQIKKIQKNYKDNLPGMMFYLHGIGEEYYKMASYSIRNETEKDTSWYYQRAIDTWEEVDFDQLRPHDAVGAYYAWADSYRKLGNYKQSNLYLRKVVSDFNDETATCKALLAMAKNFRDMDNDKVAVYSVSNGLNDALASSRLNDDSNAISLSSEISVYEYLVKNYPDTTAGKYANRVMSRCK